jgi:hypothetical protein
MMGTEVWKCSPSTHGAGGASGPLLVPFVSPLPAIRPDGWRIDQHYLLGAYRLANRWCLGRA